MITVWLIGIIIIIIIIILLIVVNKEDDSTNTNNNNNNDNDNNENDNNNDNNDNNDNNNDNNDNDNDENDNTNNDNNDENDNINVDDFCEKIERDDLTAGKITIIMHIPYRSYDCAYNLPNSTVDIPYRPSDVKGTYTFTFTANVNSIARDYNNIKNTIPVTIFNDETVQSQYENARQIGCKDIAAKKINASYPEELTIYKDDEYLIVIGYKTVIETYSYDYSFYYINNSTTTLQSKHFHKVEQTTNELYKTVISLYADGTSVQCLDKGIQKIITTKIDNLYTNEYINFCLILNNIFSNSNTEITALDDCAVTISNDYKPVTIFLTRYPYHKGIYTLADIKNSLQNMCKSIITDSNGYKYTIDLNKPYQSTPTFYNIRDKSNFNAFDTGTQLISQDDIQSNNESNVVCKYIKM